MKLLNLNDCGIIPKPDSYRVSGEAEAKAKEGKRVIRLINTKNRDGKDLLKCKVCN